MLVTVGATLSASCWGANWGSLSSGVGSGGGAGWATETSTTRLALAASPFLSLAVMVRETWSPESGVPS